MASDCDDLAFYFVARVYTNSGVRISINHTFKKRGLQGCGTESHSKICYMRLSTAFLFIF